MGLGYKNPQEKSRVEAAHLDKSERNGGSHFAGEWGDFGKSSSIAEAARINFNTRRRDALDGTRREKRKGDNLPARSIFHYIFPNFHCIYFSLLVVDEIH